MALHGGFDWDNIARWNWGALFLDGPPFLESLIWAHIEFLFWWLGLCKWVRHVRAIDEHVFTGGNCLEQPSASLIRKISISFVQNLHVARPGVFIAYALSLFVVVSGLDGVRPD